jgi:hypothetical protein
MIVVTMSATAAFYLKLKRLLGFDGRVGPYCYFAAISRPILETDKSAAPKSVLHWRNYTL